jgi:hypothetical protein
VAKRVVLSTAETILATITALAPEERVRLAQSLVNHRPFEETGYAVLPIPFLRQMLGIVPILQRTLQHVSEISNDWANKAIERKAKLSKWGRQSTAAGTAKKTYILQRRKDGRTEGEICQDVEDNYGRRPSLSYVKKIIREGIAKEIVPRRR